MNRDELRKRLRECVIKKDFEQDKNLDSSSIIRFRIASGEEISGTVPVNVLNQSWPVFVFPDVYIDGRHISSAKYIARNEKAPDAVLLKVNPDGCARLNAISDDLNITIVMFVDNYPTLNIAVNENLYEAEIIVECFSTKEQAKYFYDKIYNEIKT